MKKTKIMAAYLPQFHETKENNEFWGKGFTDWVGVKNAKPQYKGHKQPKEPLNDNYYDLSQCKTILWQAEMAKRYGIDGFNIYHYWFKNGKKMLQTPAELILGHPEIDINYFFSWDNCSWIRSWSSISGNDWSPVADGRKKEGKQCLLELDYGDEKEWKKHFEYLLPFFKDSRYLKINGKPVFAFMTRVNKKTLQEMCNYWKSLAIDNGLKGLYLIVNKSFFGRKPNLFDAQFLYQPPEASWRKRMAIDSRLKRYFGIITPKDREVKYFYDYEQVWEKLIKDVPKQIKRKLILGAMVAFDDTPRRGENARILNGASPDIFYKYFSQLYRICCKNNNDILLLTAWNEWGEGAYLEPDKEYEYGYLEAIKKTVDEILDD